MRCPKCFSHDTKKVSTVNAGWVLGGQQCCKCEHKGHWTSFLEKNQMNKIIAIVACDENYGIGFQGDIPWRNEENLQYIKDQQFFKDITYGKTVIMGRKTMESLPNHVLRHRCNIVLTKQGIEIPTARKRYGENYPLTYGPLKHKDIHFAFLFATYYFSDYSSEIFIIGGEQIYELALKEKMVDEVLLTRMPGTYKCDTFFPAKYIENWKKEKLNIEGLNVTKYKKIDE